MKHPPRDSNPYGRNGRCSPPSGHNEGLPLKQARLAFSSRHRGCERNELPLPLLFLPDQCAFCPTRSYVLRGQDYRPSFPVRQQYQGGFVRRPVDFDGGGSYRPFCATFLQTACYAPRTYPWPVCPRIIAALSKRLKADLFFSTCFLFIEIILRFFHGDVVLM